MGLGSLRARLMVSCFLPWDGEMQVQRPVIGTSTDFVRLVEELPRGQHLLALYDSDMTDALVEFLTDFVGSRPAEDLTILWKGEHSKTREEFYDECRRVIPLASYMGSGLDALNDVLRAEGLSARWLSRMDPETGKHYEAAVPAGDTYWIWRDAHHLWQYDSGFFEDVLHAFVWCARQVTNGFDGSLAEGPMTPPKVRGPDGTMVIPAWPNWVPQRVTIVITGRWDVLGTVANRDPSCFSVLAAPLAGSFSSPTTGMTCARISREPASRDGRSAEGGTL